MTNSYGLLRTYGFPARKGYRLWIMGVCQLDLKDLQQSENMLYLT